MPRLLLVFLLVTACQIAMGSSARAQSANLLPNASFESGPTGSIQEPYRGGGWRVSIGAAGTPALAARTEAVEVRAFRDTQSPAAVGIASLRIALLPGRSVKITAPSAPLEAGRSYVASVYLRADAPGTSVTVSLAGKQTIFRAGPVWEQYYVAVTATRTEFVSLEIQTANAASDARTNMLWVDGAQLEKGTQPTATYQPAYPYELRAVCDRPGHVFFDDDKMTFDALVASGAPALAPPPAGTLLPAKQSIPTVLRIALQALSGDARKNFSKEVALGDTAQTVHLTLPDVDGRKPRELFKATLELLASDGLTPLSAPTTIIYARLPRPRNVDPARSYFGVNFPLNSNFAQIAQVTGNHWVGGGGSTQAFSWSAVEPDPNRLQVFDAGTEAVPRPGLAILGTLGQMPAWLSRNSPNRPANKDAWRRYVETLLDRYKTEVGTWNVSFPEPNPIPGVSYGELLQIAGEEARNADPSTLVIGDISGDSTLRTGRVSIRQRLPGSIGELPQLPRPAWNVDSRVKVASFYTKDLSAVQTQAGQIVEWDTIQRAAGIEKSFLAATDESGERETGLLEYDRAVSAALAARATLAWLTDGSAAPAHDDTLNGVTAYTFPPQPPGILPNHKTRVTVVWNRDSAAHLIPVPRGAQVLDLWGNSLGTRGTVAVGTAPVYLLTP